MTRRPWLSIWYPDTSSSAERNSLSSELSPQNFRVTTGASIVIFVPFTVKFPLPVLQSAWTAYVPLGENAMVYRDGFETWNDSDPARAIHCHVPFMNGVVMFAMGVTFGAVVFVGVTFAVAFSAGVMVSAGVRVPAGAVVVAVVWFVGGTVVQPAATSMAAASSVSTIRIDPVRMVVQLVYRY
jgi:hypothetical protein